MPRTPEEVSEGIRAGLEAASDLSDRRDRIAVRAFLDTVIDGLGIRPGGDEGGSGYPGHEVEISEQHEWDERSDSVRVFLVTRQDLKDWLGGLMPRRGVIDIVPARSKNPTGWISRCDDCGTIAEGDMTVEGHDSVVRAWYAHDKERHSGDGCIPYGDLIGG